MRPISSQTFSIWILGVVIYIALTQFTLKKIHANGMATFEVLPFYWWKTIFYVVLGAILATALMKVVINVKLVLPISLLIIGVACLVVSFLFPLGATYEWSFKSESMIRVLTWSGNIWISIAAGFFVIASLVLFYKLVNKPVLENVEGM